MYSCQDEIYVSGTALIELESMQTFTLEPGRPKSHRGGKRAGAGRPKGSPNRAPLDRLYRVMVDGHTPLEVMLANMRRYYTDAVAYEQEHGKLATELRKEAQQCAMQAAPYCHSRHTNSVVRHELAVAELSDDELAMIAGRAKTIEHQPKLQGDRARPPHLEDRVGEVIEATPAFD